MPGITGGSWPVHTYAYNEAVDDVSLNTYIMANLTDLAGVPQAYSCAWTSTGTNPTLGASTLVAVARQAYKDVTFQITLTVGTGFTAGTGQYLLGLPVTVVSGTHPRCDGFFIDSSAAAVYPIVGYLSGTGIFLYQIGATGSPLTAFGGTSPVTIAVGDSVHIAGKYTTN